MPFFVADAIINILFLGAFLSDERLREGYCIGCFKNYPKIKFSHFFDYQVGFETNFSVKN